MIEVFKKINPDIDVKKMSDECFS